MPCRPAEHDIRYGDGKVAEGKVVEFVAARRRVRRVLFRWCGPFAEDLPVPLGSAIGAAQKDRVAPVPADPGEAAGNSGADGYPIGSWGLELMFRERPEEEKLCEERTLLARVASLLAPPHELEGVVAAELAAHRVHRQADLDALLEHLRKESEQPGGRAGPNALRAARTREHLARAEQLTVDDILTDRALLASLWELG
jgi:hypothetical protein